MISDALLALILGFGIVILCVVGLLGLAVRGLFVKWRDRRR